MNFTAIDMSESAIYQVNFIEKYRKEKIPIQSHFVAFGRLVQFLR